MTAASAGEMIGLILGTVLVCFLFLFVVCIILVAIILAVVCAYELYVYMREKIEYEIERNKTEVRKDRAD